MNRKEFFWIAKLFFLWRLNLFLLKVFGSLILPLRKDFLGPTPWANFDGVHYLQIAKKGYLQYEQAFFPLYPILIRLVGWLTSGKFIIAGLIISHLSIALTLIIFWRLIPLKDINQKKWVLIFFLFFPTSFYFASLYTESLFLLIVLGSFFALENRKWLTYFFSASIASATRLVGVFLLVPGGLVLYMLYLARNFSDALFFIHAQPAFGAGRSGSKLIFLPQVYLRYIKIFSSVSQGEYIYWIAMLEFLMFNLTLFLLWLAWKKRLPILWILFSFASVIGPTLTGTLSSVPRYVLVAFPIYIVLASLNKNIRLTLFILFYLCFSILTILFTRGYWVA